MVILLTLKLDCLQSFSSFLKQMQADAINMLKVELSWFAEKCLLYALNVLPMDTDNKCGLVTDWTRLVSCLQAFSANDVQLVVS